VNYNQKVRLCIT